ncbi:hypothetical protein SS37A_39370 (plasmid) [Methylocystis iwaonis]|uniref:Uncharacterized protein n=1 Tax=Methylocystis iwaonis TaxID=2885079 RepID=A0ABN6VQY4_9HYPH|nr:hypothetical protein SS37A_39370 [Methylocystis iwaonis]
MSAIGAGSQSYQFVYDNNDNLIKVTDPRANAQSIWVFLTFCCSLDRSER